jgi:hypothetical protein
VEDLPEVQHGVEEGVLGPGLAIKNPPKKKHKKPPKNHLKTTKNVFFGFLGFLKIFIFYENNTNFSL